MSWLVFLQVINLLFSDIFLLLTCISMPLCATTPGYAWNVMFRYNILVLKGQSTNAVFTCNNTPLCASTFGHGFLAFPCSNKTSGTIFRSWPQSLNKGSSGRCFRAKTRWAVYLGSVCLKTACPKPGTTCC